MMLKKVQLSFLPAIIWLTLSTFLLIIPGSALPQQNWLGKIWIDKWIHIWMFAILVWLFCRAIHKGHTKNTNLTNTFIIIALLCITYGIAMEYVQKYFVANRSFDTGDIIADIVGCTIGFLYSKRKFI